VALARKRTIPPSDRRFSAKLVPTFADIGCRVVSATDPHGRSSRFSRPEPLLFLPSSSSVVLTRLSGPVPDPLLLRTSGSAENVTRDIWICRQELWPLDHRGGLPHQLSFTFSYPNVLIGAPFIIVVMLTSEWKRVLLEAVVCGRTEWPGETGPPMQEACYTGTSPGPYLSVVG
jgi:hypothetical protein